MKWLLFLALVSCSPSARNIQVQTANAVAVAANAAAPLIVAAYKKEGVACIDDSPTLVEADACLTKLEFKYGKVRIAWMGMRRAQLEWSEALERSDAKISDYMVSMEHAYCDLSKELPSVPKVPGLTCP